MLDPLWQLVEVIPTTSTDPFLQTPDGQIITDPDQIVQYLISQSQLTPDVVEQLKTAKVALVRLTEQVLKGGDIKASDPVIQHRREICSTCPFRIRSWFVDRCSKCGCGLKAKTATFTESCPEGKW